VMPLFQLLLFAYAISFDVRNVPSVVLDQDKTTASRAYLDAVSQSGFFRIQGSVPDLKAIDRAFDQSRARVAVVVAQGYGADIAAGRKGKVDVLIDGSEPNSAQLGQNYATALDNAYNRQTLVSWASARGQTLSGVGMLDPRVRTWYNPDRRSADFLVPGLMVVIIMVVTVQQTAVTLVRERESGTLDQLLVSPLLGPELITGKVLPWALLGFADIIAITAVSVAVFQIPLRGDLLVLGVGSFFFIMCCLSIGLIISALAPSIESANLLALLISLLPGFMLSGLAFPLDSIPLFLQWVSYAFPGRYMVDVARGVFLRGTSWGVLWQYVASLGVYMAVGLGLATALNRRRAS